MCKAEKLIVFLHCRKQIFEDEEEISASYFYNFLETDAKLGLKKSRFVF
jgi:hypothetical protein